MLNIAYQLDWVIAFVFLVTGLLLTFFLFITELSPEDYSEFIE